MRIFFPLHASVLNIVIDRIEMPSCQLSENIDIDNTDDSIPSPSAHVLLFVCVLCYGHSRTFSAVCRNNARNVGDGQLRSNELLIISVDHVTMIVFIPPHLLTTVLPILMLLPLQFCSIVTLLLSHH